MGALCKDLERTEVKKWLNQILEILMAERAKSQQETENEKLNVLIKKHEELIPSVQKTSVMVDLYWKCYAYGDEMKPHIEFLDGIMLSSTRDIAPSCVENVDELIERQEKSLVQLDSKKRYNLDDALADLKKRQDLYNKSKNTINGLFKDINDNFTCMSITLPEDKKKIVDKEIKAVDAKLEVVTRFRDTVKVIEDFCAALVNFDTSLKTIDEWKEAATAELKDIKEASGAMLPEDRVARTMDLQEDIAAKLEILAENAKNELELLPQGDKVPAAANGAAQKMTTHAEADAEVAGLKERYVKVK